jgi:membrane protein
MDYIFLLRQLGLKIYGMGSKHTSAHFKIKDLPFLVARTFRNWLADNPWRLGAVVAYYAVLALPGLLVIIINFVGAVWGVEIVQGELIDEISQTIGADTGEAIKNMIKETQQEDKSLISTILGIAILIYGATGVFYQLQISLNKIWKIPETPGPGIIKLITDRARGFAFILALGFLMLVSFIVTAVISVLSNYFRSLLPEIVIYIAYGLDLLFSIGIITVLFALIFKYLPDAKIRWKTVWIGAFITALLFSLGKFLMGLYFGEANPGTTYGAAGTIVLILLWVSYSSMILFFGAEFTWVYAEQYGLGIKASGRGSR